MRRRATSAALAVMPVVLVACGSEPSKDVDHGATGDASEGPAIVVTTTDGETLKFSDFVVTCRPTHEDDGVRWKTAVRAIAGAGDGDPMTDRKVPAMMIEADADVADGSTVALPHHNKWGKKPTFVEVFITHAGPATELSSAEEESLGEIEVVSAGCDPNPHLELSIDASLHSEYIDGGQVTAVGSMSSK